MEDYLFQNTPNIYRLMIFIPGISKYLLLTKRRNSLFIRSIIKYFRFIKLNSPCIIIRSLGSNYQ